MRCSSHPRPSSSRFDRPKPSTRCYLDNNAPKAGYLFSGHGKRPYDLYRWSRIFFPSSSTLIMSHVTGIDTVEDKYDEKNVYTQDVTDHVEILRPDEEHHIKQ